MKVILLKHIPQVGKAGEVKEVSTGYARNFLLPKKMAQEATADAIERVAEIQAKAATEAAAGLAGAQALVDRLEGQSFEVKAKASSEGTLYASLPASKIAAALKEKGFEVKKEHIKVEHIKELGEHEVTVTIDHSLEARIVVMVQSE